MRTFTIKIMNFFYNLLTNLLALFKKSSKQFGMAISAIRQNSLLKFNELIANFFFSNKMWSYMWQYFIKSSSRQCPCCRSFFIFLCCNEYDTTSKSFNKPFKNRIFSITYFYSNVINFIRLIFRFPVLYSETSFRIYKSCEIWIINFFIDSNSFASRYKTFSSVMKLFICLSLRICSIRLSLLLRSSFSTVLNLFV
jgi:hypothetical protein